MGRVKEAREMWTQMAKILALLKIVGNEDAEDVLIRTFTFKQYLRNMY